MLVDVLLPSAGQKCSWLHHMQLLPLLHLFLLLLFPETWLMSRSDRFIFRDHSVNGGVCNQINFNLIEENFARVWRLYYSSGTLCHIFQTMIDFRLNTWHFSFKMQSLAHTSHNIFWLQGPSSHQSTVWESLIVLSPTVLLLPTRYEFRWRMQTSVSRSAGLNLVSFFSPQGSGRHHTQRNTMSVLMTLPSSVHPIRSRLP